MSETAVHTSKGACGICHGGFDEHGPGKTQHAWVPQGSTQLITHEQQKKQEQKPAQPTVVRLSNGTATEGGAINRMIELLMEKGLLNTDEALYIVGIGEKPKKPSGFADPVTE